MQRVGLYCKPGTDLTRLLGMGEVFRRAVCCWWGGAGKVENAAARCRYPQAS